MAVVLNGNKVAWVSCRVILPQQGKKPLSISSLTYPNVARAKEHVYGSGQENIGHTFDSLKIDEGEMVFLMSEFDEIADGQGEVLSKIPFDIVISYADANATTRTDIFYGVHWTGFQPTISQGTDPGRVTVKWKPDGGSLNGVLFVTPS